MNGMNKIKGGVSKWEMTRPDEKEAVWGSKDFQAADFCRIFQNIRFSGDKFSKICKNKSFCGLFPLLLACFAIFPHIFFRLNAMAKKAKSMVTLSLPKWRNLLYPMLYFIWPKTASGSIHRRPLCSSPFSEVSSSLAFFLYWLSRWLTSRVLLSVFDL